MSSWTGLWAVLGERPSAGSLGKPPQRILSCKGNLIIAPSQGRGENDNKCTFPSCSWMNSPEAHLFLSRTILLGFPGGAVVENLPANAGHTGSSPGLGRSHMPRSSWACEPQLLSLRVWSLCSTTREAAIVRGPRPAMKSGPRLPQLEEALTQKRRPNTAKINK